MWSREHTKLESDGTVGPVFGPRESEKSLQALHAEDLKRLVTGLLLVKLCSQKFADFVHHRSSLQLEMSSRSFLAALSVLVFQVPMVMLSLPRIFDDAPAAHLTLLRPGVRRKARSFLTRAATDPV